jgi:mono/diheme cytochrome c family protein
MLLAAATAGACHAEHDQAPVQEPSPVTAVAPDAQQLAAAQAIARAGCVRCHELPTPARERLVPPQGPPLAAAWRARVPDLAAEFLRTHHGGDDAVDLAAYLRHLATDQPALRAVAAPAGEGERGATLWGELACGACHGPTQLAHLSQCTDVPALTAFLHTPAAHRPALLAHDFRLVPGEAEALAQHLLAAQVAATPEPLPGFAYECFELRIASAALPELAGLEPAARGHTETIGVDVRTRDDHFALRFSARLEVPAAGEWKFTIGSDDSSWLWIDDQLVVRNEALAPHRRRSGKVQLAAGPHQLRVVYTEAEGGQSLEALWQGPDVPAQPIPASAARAEVRAFVPPAAAPPSDAAAVARGRSAARARACAACHALAEPEFAALPVPAPARPFAALGAGECPRVDGAAGLRAAAGTALTVKWQPAAELELALRADGCLACHRREGQHGLPRAVLAGLREREDLGDEGRLPPDLTAVGHRLRPQWLTRFLAGEATARAYVAVRMPKLPAARAGQYAAWFAAADGRPGDDDAPPFDPAQVEAGRALAGVGGKNCLTCHAIAGHRALGPQGMDLARQHERLRPAWFRDWLLHAARLRPGTRMPTLWADDGPEAQADAVALWHWMSLGAAMPMPAGVPLPGGLVLEPRDAVILHGAFLKGLSARCLAVGSPLRTHYAYDLTHGQLAWLWRGAFLDAEGTWSGRAGQLLEPLGEAWQVLPALGFPQAVPELRGQEFGSDGHPVFRFGHGSAEWRDRSAPRLAAGGGELVRSLSVQSGALVVVVPDHGAAVQVTTAGRAATGEHRIAAGQTLELVYRW